jgi:hypothetical protein
LALGCCDVVVVDALSAPAATGFELVVLDLPVLFWAGWVALPAGPVDDDDKVFGFIWIIFLVLVGGGGKLNSSRVAAALFVPPRDEVVLIRRPPISGDAGETGVWKTTEVLRLLLLLLLPSVTTGLKAAGGRANECSDMLSIGWSLICSSPEAAGVGGRRGGMFLCVELTVLQTGLLIMADDIDHQRDIDSIAKV